MRAWYSAVAGKPVRERAAEDFLRGKSLAADLADQVVPRTLANAAPLKYNYNAMKIEMAKGLLASGLAQLV